MIVLVSSLPCPPGRHDASPAEIVVLRKQTNDPLEVARQFREWRLNSKSTGDIPRPRTLRQKINDLPSVERLLGAPHCYLWGPNLFSRHDIPQAEWQRFARELNNATPGSLLANLRDLFSNGHRKSLQELASKASSSPFLANHVALAINKALSSPDLLGLGTETPLAEVIRLNKQALARSGSDYLNTLEILGRRQLSIDDKRTSQIRN